MGYADQPAIEPLKCRWVSRLPHSHIIDSRTLRLGLEQQGGFFCCRMYHRGDVERRASVTVYGEALRAYFCHRMRCGPIACVAVCPLTGNVHLVTYRRRRGADCAYLRQRSPGGSTRADPAPYPNAGSYTVDFRVCLTAKGLARGSCDGCGRLPCMRTAAAPGSLRSGLDNISQPNSS